MERLNVRIIGTFLGDCYVIQDTVSGKNVEIMAVQLKGIVNSSRETGSLPHGEWEKKEQAITIYHDDERDKHEVTFTMQELLPLLN